MTRGTHPEPLDGKEAVEDRVCSVFGLNLYDAGTWSIALALQNEFEIQRVYNRQILYSSTTGRMDEVGCVPLGSARRVSRVACPDPPPLCDALPDGCVRARVCF
jgi:hypothetical protein